MKNWYQYITNFIPIFLTCERNAHVVKFYVAIMSILTSIKYHLKLLHYMHSIYPVTGSNLPQEGVSRNIVTWNLKRLFHSNCKHRAMLPLDKISSNRLGKKHERNISHVKMSNAREVRRNINFFVRTCPPSPFIKKFSLY